MDKNKRVEEEIEKTLHLMDNIELLKPNPYLYTRVKAAIEKSGRVSNELNKEKALSVKLLPAFLLLLVILNFYSIIDFSSTNDTTIQTTNNREEYMQQLGQEFMLNQSSYYPNTME